MRRTPFALLLAILAAGTALAQEDTGATYKKAMELYRAGKYEQALPLFKKSLDLAQARYGDQSPLLALDLNNLAEIYRRLERYAEAEPLYKRAVALDEAGGEDNPDLATSLNNLALLYKAQKRYPEAETLYKRSLALQEKVLGPSHADLAGTLNNLAMLYRLEGAADKARPLQARALAIAEKELGPDHPTTKLMQRNLTAMGGPPAEDAVPAPAPVAPPAKDAGAKKLAGLKRPPTTVLPPPADVDGRPPPPAKAAAVAKPSPRAAAPSPPPSAKAVAAGTPAAGQQAPSGPQPRALIPSTLPKPQAAAKPTPAAGPFTIHFASVRDAAGAAAEQQRLARRYPSLAGLSAAPPQAVDVPGQGAFYRVALGSFPTRAEAQSLCDRVRAQGATCRVLP